jgi:hypothetical protein
VSVYYKLFCEPCGEAVNFVARGDIFTWMVDADIEVPKFLARHAEHLGAVRILGEDEVACRQHEAMFEETQRRRSA